MAKNPYHSIDAYIAAQPPATQIVLEKVRATIRKALPKTEEAISYNIPAFKLNGKAFIYFAGWKEHFSLYPATGRVAIELKDELANHIVSKGTIRFPLDKPVPAKLITAIARIRAADEEERQHAKFKPARRAKS